MPARTFSPVVARQIAPPAIKPPTAVARRVSRAGAPVGLPRFAAAASRPAVAISKPRDRWEAEAGKVADTVARQPAPAARSSGAQAPRLRFTPSPSRAAENGTTQARAVARNAPRHGPPPPRPLYVMPTSPLEGLASTSLPLAPATRRQIERITGADVGAVRVHTGAAVDRASAAVQARAFTIGSHIYLRSGETASDLRLVAHETAHAIQQAARPASDPRTALHRSGEPHSEGTISTAAPSPRRPTGSQPRATLPRGPPTRAAPLTLSPAPLGMVQRLPLGVVGEFDRRLFWPLILTRPLVDALWVMDAHDFVPSLARLANDGITTMLLRFPLQPGHFSWVLTWFRNAPLLRTHTANVRRGLFGGVEGPLAAGLRSLSHLLAQLCNGNWRWFAEALTATHQTFVWFRDRFGPGFRDLGVLVGYPRLGATLASLADELRANTTALDASPHVRDHVAEILGYDGALTSTQDLVAWVEAQQSLFLGAPSRLRAVAGDLATTFSFLDPMLELRVLGGATAELRQLLDETAQALEEPDEVRDDARVFKVLLPRLQGHGVWLGDAIEQAALWPPTFAISLLQGAHAWVATLHSRGHRTSDWFAVTAREINATMEARFEPGFDALVAAFKESGVWFGHLQQLFVAMEPAMADENTPEIKPSLLIRALRKLGVPEELLTKLQHAAHALGKVVRHPFRFFRNLAAAIVGGLHTFAGNIGRHLMDAIASWMFGELQPISAPNPFTLPNALRALAPVIGFTFDNFLKVLARKHPRAAEKLERATRAGTVAVSWVKLLWEKNYAQLWQELKAYLYNFWSQLVMKVQSLLIDHLMSKGLELLVNFLTPGLRQAVKIVREIYRTVKQLKAQAQRMLNVVNSVCNYVADIVDGKLDAAIQSVENLAVRALRFAVRFFADWLGLGEIPAKLREALESVRGFIDRVLEQVIELGRKVWEWLGEQVANALEWWRNKNVFQNAAREVHELFFKGTGPDSVLTIKSDEKTLKKYLETYVAANDTEKGVVTQIKTRATKIDQLKAKTGNSFGEEDGAAIRDHFNAIAQLLAKLGGGDEAVPSTTVKWRTISDLLPPLTWDDGAEMEAVYLSLDPGGHVGSEPYEESALWKKVRRRSNTYVRGHLLNHHLHGPGAKRNLVPITIAANNHMKDWTENVLKKAVLSERKVVRYEVRAEFGQTKRKHIPEESALPEFIRMKATVLQKTGGTWQPVSGPPLSSSRVPNKLPDDTLPK